MLSLASLRYRNVLVEDGGPVGRVASRPISVRGRPMMMATAALRPGLVHKQRNEVYGNADGTGCDPVAVVARHKAISEALERWACDSIYHSDRRKEFGFDIDPSSNGASAFPGLVRRQARRSAVLEAVERFSLMAWWEGKAEGRCFDTDWPGVSAVAIDGPFGGVTVIAYASTEWGGYVYGHAAEESFGAACERAVMELARQEMVLRSRWLAIVGGQFPKPANVFEQRCLFFATNEGHELFMRRVRSRATGAMPRPEVICDSDIPGPWDEYATVWRFALRPISDGYLRGGERYFFL